MKLQTRLAVLVCKASGAVLRRLGRGGTNLPGKLALKIDKNILGELSRGVIDFCGILYAALFDTEKAVSPLAHQGYFCPLLGRGAVL